MPTPPSPPPATPPNHRPRRAKFRKWSAALAALALITFLAVWFLWPDGAVPDFTIPIGQVRAPLPYRIVSFHRGRVDKNLIKLASQLGFNGVQIQLEGSNVAGIQGFAARDQKEHIVDYCHAHGMAVTVWVHELSDLPLEDSPDYLGPISVDNDKLWKVISDRYEWILTQALPQVDGLVLSVVETEFNATDADIMRKLVTLINQKCLQHGKQLTVRTFVWHPEQLAGVLAAIQSLPGNILVMSKIVPQDWQMRAPIAAEIGAVGDHPQVVEFDVAGEYFLSDSVANCMVDHLKSQFDDALSKHAQGICVRVDRFDSSVLWTPNEVNLWTLGLLASGASNDTEDIWHRWATYRYGDKAAPAIIAALKPTSQVIAEMLSIGPFTYGDTRGSQPDGRPNYDVALPDDDVLGELEESNQNWQMWHWDPNLITTRDKLESGDPASIAAIGKSQAAAALLADQSLADLEKARAFLSSKDFQILHTRLLTNQVQLAFRSHATLAALHWRQAMSADTTAQYNAAIQLYKTDLAAVGTLAQTLKAYPPAATIHYLGKNWQVGRPLLINTQQLNEWLDQANLDLQP